MIEKIREAKRIVREIGGKYRLTQSGDYIYLKELIDEIEKHTVDHESAQKTDK